MKKNISQKYATPPGGIDQRIRKVLDNNEVGIWEWYPGNDYLYWDDVMLSLHGVSSHHFMHTTEIWDECIHGDDLDRYKYQLHESLQAGKTFCADYRCCLPDGSITYLKTKGTVTGDNRNPPAVVSGICYDVSGSHQLKQDLHRFNEELEEKITAKTHDLQKAKQAALSLMQDADQHSRRAKQALQRAEEANRAKSDFLATISHEIRTPLNAIIGMTYLVMNTTLDSKQKKHLGIVHDSAQSLLEIVNDMLDYAKLEGGRLRIEERVFNLLDLINATLLPFKKALTDKGVEFFITREEDIPEHLKGAPLRIVQVLQNLLSNAVKFTAEGKVELHLKQLKNGRAFYGIEFAVSDTGIGMNDEQTEKLFESISQVDSSSTRMYEGTGLGLIICSSLLKRMGGSIQVESSPGLGTTFRVTLPLTAVDSPTAHTQVHLSLRGLKVLLLAEEPGKRQELEDTLSSFSFEVDSIASLEEAQKLPWADSGAKKTFELVIIDSPHFSLRSVFQSLRLDSKKMHQIPVIVLISGNEPSVLVREFELRPLTQTVSTPVDRQVLLQTILSLYGVPHVNDVPAPPAANRQAGEPTDAYTATDLEMVVDVETGLARAHGSLDLYTDQVETFLKNARQFVRDTAKHASNRGATNLQQLKKDAANIGAVTLQNSCLRLEQQGTANGGRHGKYLAALTESLDLFERRILSYLREGKTADRANIANFSGNAESSGNASLFQEDLIALKVLLQKSDMEAEAYYDEIRPLLLQRYAEDVHRLDIAIEGLDFKKALSIINKMTS